ncbi:hypothetical protein IFM89_021968 [Coptis chinensis]|uniref:Sucrose synthase N-terminal domain-containing protein n=1 Tax=Coptis chinensis TaxID=261450 RepID=A0A835LVZ9_9MAGN|nr:hypothetical protein IFM89_021968 [Coptis chinensis]
MWLQDRSCTEQVQLAFEIDTAGSPSFTLCNKLKQCQKNLKWWNKNIFGLLDTKMQDAQHRLEQIQYEILSQTDPGDDLFAAEHTQIQRYNDLLVQQATHWGQKSCSDWYKFGDLNTKYFHALVKCRRQRSFIHRISDPTGAILTERRQIGDRLTEFFATLMTTSEPSFDSEILNVETPVLTGGLTEEGWEFREVKIACTTLCPKEFLQATTLAADRIRTCKGSGLYAMNTTKELEFVKEIVASTGIILDPVCRSGKFASTSSDSIADSMPEGLRQSRYHMKRCFARFVEKEKWLMKRKDIMEELERSIEDKAEIN